ncbi:MAG: sulfite exporter TauE/SafE family protein [Clostridiales bacterium]|nr:sulfite exporter TauE/SafE family protein [Clostridiales bacterium]
MFGLTWLQFLLLALAAIIIGFGKTGITGATLPAVALVAYIFGGKVSSGIMLSALIIADIPAIYHYGKDGKLKDVFRVLLPAVLGIVLGSIVGNYLDDRQFKNLMAIIVILCVIILIYREFINKDLQVPQSKWFHYIVGIIAGFSSMVGNAAGPVMSVYLLSLSFMRQRFLGTAAWFFFFVNLIKVPLHIFIWGTISLSTLKYTAVMIPFILLGAFIGVAFIKKINEKIVKWLIIIVTIIAAIRLMF